VCVTVAVKGPRSGRFGLLIGASLTGWLGSHMLMRSWHGLSKTIPEIYEEPLRTGGRMSFAAKLLSLLCIGLGIMGFMAKYAA